MRRLKSLPLFQSCFPGHGGNLLFKGVHFRACGFEVDAHAQEGIIDGHVIRQGKELFENKAGA